MKTPALGLVLGVLLFGCDLGEDGNPYRDFKIAIDSLSKNAGDSLQASDTVRYTASYDLKGADTVNNEYFLLCRFYSSASTTVGPPGTPLTASLEGRLDGEAVLAGYWDRVLHPVRMEFNISQRNRISRAEYVIATSSRIDYRN
jgi:hypothetical protein